MFAKHENGALCLADYKDLKKGAIVPLSNELYAQVEEWLVTNSFQTMPLDFYESLKTSEQKRTELQQVRDEALESITHTLLDGSVYQARLSDMAILKASVAKGVDRKWMMLNNLTRMATIKELTDVLAHGDSEIERIWDEYMTAVDLL